MVVNTASSTKSPREIVTGKKLDLLVDVLAPFGQIVSAPNPPTLRNNKDSNNTLLGVIVGKDPLGRTGMLIYVPSTGQIISREARTFTLVDKPPKTWNWTPNKYYMSLDKPEHNIIVSRVPESNMTANPTNVQGDSPRDFNNSKRSAITPIAVQLQDASPSQIISESSLDIPTVMPTPTGIQLQDTTTSPELNDSEESDSDEDPNKTHYATDDGDLPDDGDDDDDDDDMDKGTQAPNIPSVSQTTQSNIQSSTTRKSSRQSKPPSKYSDYSYGYSMTIKQANKSHRELAKEATINELNNMETKNVFKPVKFKDIPEKYRKKILRSHAFVKEKYDANGKITKLKVRLVAGGNTETPEMYTVSSSPTVSTASINTAAYLNAPIDTIIYMELPRDCSEEWVNIDPINRSQYLSRNYTIFVLILRAIYGLIQSGALWYKDISRKLCEADFTPTQTDPCLFYSI